jgi:hypothetical protein
MNVEELVPLTNGLSVFTGGQTLVCERARLTPVAKEAVDMAFWLAGTDFRPRLRLTRERIAKWSPSQATRILSHVVVNAVTGERASRP